MKVSPEVMKLIETAESRDQARYEAEYRRERAEAARRRQILDLKLADYDRVWDDAEFLDNWRIGFIQTPEAARIWRLLGREARLPIFTAKFWRGEPAPADDRTCWAALTLDGWMHHLRYEEWHKGQCSMRGERLTCCQEIFDALHPYFLRQAREHLEGPDAWKYILQELRRRT